MSTVDKFQKPAAERVFLCLKCEEQYGKHPCEKPADMLKQIISASSRLGDIVADLFMGSGLTVKAAIELGRRAIGVELEADRFIHTVSEIEDLNRT